MQTLLGITLPVFALVFCGYAPRMMWQAAGKDMAADVVLRGVVTSGMGRGAQFMRLEWVRRALRDAVGFDPYPGTLNVRLDDPGARRRWQELRAGDGLALTPPPPDRCGGRLIAVVLAPDVPAAVIVPDATSHGEDVLEVVAGVHLRSRLGLRDGDRVTLSVPGP